MGEKKRNIPVRQQSNKNDSINKILLGLSLLFLALDNTQTKKWKIFLMEKNVNRKRDTVGQSVGRVQSTRHPASSTQGYGRSVTGVFTERLRLHTHTHTHRHKLGRTNAGILVVEKKSRWWCRGVCVCTHHRRERTEAGRGIKFNQKARRKLNCQ